MRRFLVSMVLLLLVVVLGFVAFSFYQWTVPRVGSDTTLVIEPGTGTRAILAQLHGEGLAPELTTIALPFLLNGNWRSLKAGEYAFTAGMSANQVVDTIADGKVVVHSVTIPEGFTVAQARARLMAEPLLTGALPASIPEGSLFPDTWQFQRGELRASVIARMQARMQRELGAAWEQRDDGLPVVSSQEALILASIVEEETGVAHERGEVAGVYLNRLAVPMRLQSDPTVAYGIAPGGMKRMLTRRDLERDNAYNTYTRDGLPPGPICNPGLASIKAVMHPKTTKAIYFVATGDGGHRFAATLKEHEANVRAYRAVQRTQRTKAAAQ